MENKVHKRMERSCRRYTPKKENSEKLFEDGKGTNRGRQPGGIHGLMGLRVWRDPRAREGSPFPSSSGLLGPEVGRGCLLQFLTMLQTKEFCTCWAGTFWAAHIRRTKVTATSRLAPPLGRTSKSLGQEAQVSQTSSQQNNFTQTQEK